MSYKTRGDVAIVKTGESFAILCSSDTGKELAKVLAGVVREEVGNPESKRAQLLDDLFAALSATFGISKRPKRKRIITDTIVGS